VSQAWAAAALRLRTGRRRTTVAAATIAVASLLLGTAVTVGYGLVTGFDRAADAADLPDVIAQFDERPVAGLDATLRALPNVAAVAYRYEFTNVPIGADGHSTSNGAVDIVDPGPHGYAIVAGRDVGRSPRHVVVERGLAKSWGLGVGDRVDLAQAGTFRVAGIGVDPENVAFPLATQAHVWLPASALASLPAGRLDRANVALIWLADPRRADVTLQQGRATSFDIGGLRFLTRDGVRVLHDEAAGIIVALLAAVSLVAVIAAGVLLSARASADVRRGVATLGVQRALGFSGEGLAGGWALAAALVALPAAAAGLALGALIAHGPAAALLEALNELPPGDAVIAPLAATLCVVTALVAASAWVPAGRAARKAPVSLLRGAELAAPRAHRSGRSPLRAGAVLLGARLAVSRRGRALTVVAILATTGAVLVLLLALASLLSGLRDDPSALGRRYQLSVDAPARDAPAVARIPGVLAAAPRYTIDAAASFALEQPVRLIAFQGDHTPFEAPPLAAGRRLRSDSEAEVGQGLADALGLRVGSPLAVQVGERELRFRVAGIVRALEHDGRVAYIRAAPALRAEPGAPGVIAIRLRPGADRAQVERAVAATTGVSPGRPSTATPRSRAFLGTLASLLRVVAIVVGGVSLLALLQALGTLIAERGATLAVLRAGGAGPATVVGVLAGAIAVLVVPALAAALAIERFALGPLVTGLAVGYADLSLTPSAGQTLIVVVAFAAISGSAALLATRALLRAPIVEGLRSE
jgi:predicted lysophospholipase L1 biosynthesis ABC-type transport system permease subunit